MTAQTAEDVRGMVRADEAAPRLRVSVRTVIRAVARGQIPGLKIGTVTLVNGAWLDEVTTWPQEATS